MQITWYGQSCFKIEGKDVTLLIDPFSKEIGLTPPRIKADIIAVTHDHYDHSNLDNASEGAFIIKGPGEYEVKNVFVHGLLSYHDKSEGKERGLNTIFEIRMEDITLCHLGDLGQTKLSEEQVDALGDIDILFIPVGGTYTINGQEAAEIISQIEPKIIIPMHYAIPGLKVDLDDAKKFIKTTGLTPEETDVFKINKKSLPQDETKLVVLKP